MEPLPIIKHLDVLKAALFGCCSDPIVLVVYPFVLQRSEEVLGHRVIEALALAAHTAPQAVVTQLLPVGARGAGAALAGMNDNVTHFPTVPDGHGQGLLHQFGVVPVTHGLTDYLTGEELQDHGEIQPSLASGNERGIGDPGGVRPVDDKLFSAARVWRRFYRVCVVMSWDTPLGDDCL